MQFDVPNQFRKEAENIDLVGTRESGRSKAEPSSDRHMYIWDYSLVVSGKPDPAKAGIAYYYMCCYVGEFIKLLSKITSLIVAISYFVYIQKTWKKPLFYLFEMHAFKKNFCDRC